MIATFLILLCLVVVGLKKPKSGQINLRIQKYPNPTLILGW